MLVLTRNEGEAVVVFQPDGTELGRVKVVSVRGDKARLGMEFPREYAVHRAEVAAEIAREKVADGVR